LEVGQQLVIRRTHGKKEAPKRAEVTNAAEQSLAARSNKRLRMAGWADADSGRAYSTILGLLSWFRGNN
jgi:hypothetical protein